MTAQIKNNVIEKRNFQFSVRKSIFIESLILSQLIKIFDNFREEWSVSSRKLILSQKSKQKFRKMSFHQKLSEKINFQENVYFLENKNIYLSLILHSFKSDHSGHVLSISCLQKLLLLGGHKSFFRSDMRH